MKILAYNSSARGSGQFVRSLKIAKIITERYKSSSFLILVGNSYANKLLPNQTDIIRIPEVSKNLLGEYISQLNSVSKSFAIRKAIIESTVECYNPDVFLVDSRPTGLDGELLSILKKMKRISKCKIVLILRDIVDHSDLVKARWSGQGIYRLIDEIYDKVIVLGDKEIYNAIDKYDLLFCRKKIFHIGYIGCYNRSLFDGDNIQNKEISGRILVTVGGGFDGGTIIETVCEFINKVSVSEQQFSYKLVLGSNSPLKQHSLFQHYKLISHNIQIFTHVECLESFISEAELVISMCGYNTFTELIGKRKKIIVIPRWHSGSEQLIRAKALAKYYDGIWILQKRDFTIKKLDALINHVICSPPPKVKFKMKGNEGLISFFKKELGCE